MDPPVTHQAVVHSTTDAVTARRAAPLTFLSHLRIATACPRHKEAGVADYAHIAVGRGKGYNPAVKSQKSSRHRRQTWTVWMMKFLTSQNYSSGKGDCAGSIAAGAEVHQWLVQRY